MDKEAVDKVADLAKSAAGFTIHPINVKGLSPGLPDAFPIGFDHRPNLPQGNPIQAVRDMRELAEKWRLHPERRKGTAEVNTLQSFIDLTNRHKTEHSVIFAATRWPDPSLTAVIDYHEKNNGKPAFGEHVVSYPFPLTDELKAWAGQDGVPMNQGQFAAFIEERVADLASATDNEKKELAALFGTTMANPAEMLALSRGLEVNVAGKVKQNVRLSSGEGEIVFVEEHLDSKGEKVVVPGLFMVCTPAFLDGVAVRLPARLRYRVAGGSVSWFYQLYRWKEILRDRVVADLERAKDATDLPAYEGEQEVD